MLRAIVDGTVPETGEVFFAALVRTLCEALWWPGPPYDASTPPSTASTCPVTIADASDAR